MAQLHGTPTTRHAAREMSTSAGASLPPLSRTFLSSQLHTPRQLHRVTIDNTNYHGYLARSRECHPPHLTALERRVAKMGDNYFFVHRDIPPHQQYARTSIRLSEVRPWDQIVARPLVSDGDQVLHKEVELPFPAEHPYTSHMSRFAVFPDTRSEPRPLRSQPEITVCMSTGRANSVNAQTQTPNSHTLWSPGYNYSGPTHHRSSTPYYVLQKASEGGRRVESRYVGQEPPLEPERTGSTLWDVPRTQRHKRAYTYPAPALRFATRPTHLSPNTNAALNSIHRTIARTTAYSESFSGHSTGLQNYLRLDSPFYHRVSSYRPHTTESRGKYNKAHYSGSTAPNPAMIADGTTTEEDDMVDELGVDGDEVEGPERVVGKNKMGEDTHQRSDGLEGPLSVEVVSEGGPIRGSGGESGWPPVPAERHTPEVSLHGKSAGTGLCMVEQGTQTDFEGAGSCYLPPVPAVSASVFHGRALSDHQPSTNDSHLALPRGNTRPKSASALEATNHPNRFSGSHKKNLPRYRSLSTGSNLPRSALSTQRLANLYFGFSKSTTMRRFHQEYPENAPDLREYGIRDGKRHIIHGYHGYYFH